MTFDFQIDHNQRVWFRSNIPHLDSSYYPEYYTRWRIGYVVSWFPTIGQERGTLKESRGMSALVHTGCHFVEVPYQDLCLHKPFDYYQIYAKSRTVLDVLEVGRESVSCRMWQISTGWQAHHRRFETQLPAFIFDRRYPGGPNQYILTVEYAKDDSSRVYYCDVKEYYPKGLPPLFFVEGNPPYGFIESAL